MLKEERNAKLLALISSLINPIQLCNSILERDEQEVHHYLETLNQLKLLLQKSRDIIYMKL